MGTQQEGVKCMKVGLESNSAHEDYTLTKSIPVSQTLYDIVPHIRRQVDWCFGDTARSFLCPIHPTLIISLSCR